MIISIGCTQFVFLSLGILALNVLLKAGGYAPDVADKFPSFAVQLAQNGLWMFCIPLGWVAFAAICTKAGHAFLASVARISGVVLIIAIFAVYYYASSLFF